MKPVFDLSPLRKMLIAGTAIFMIQFEVMVAMAILFPDLAKWTQALLDSTALVLFLLPILYMFILRPLETEITLRLRSESELLEARSNLELKIQERTAQLEQRNQQSILYAQMGELLQTCYTKEEACRVMERIAVQMFPHISGALYIYSPSRNDLDLLTSWGGSTNMKSVILPSECWALRRGKAHREETSEAEAVCLTCHGKVGYNTLCLPMMEAAKLPHLPDAHIGIVNNIFCLPICETFVLNISCGLDSLANGFACFADSVAAEFFIVHARNFNMDIDSIDHGTGDNTGQIVTIL